jgi:hypothetical protein
MGIEHRFSLAEARSLATASDTVCRRADCEGRRAGGHALVDGAVLEDSAVVELLSEIELTP